MFKQENKEKLFVAYKQLILYPKEVINWNLMPTNSIEVPPFNFLSHSTIHTAVLLLYSRRLKIADRRANLCGPHRKENIIIVWPARAVVLG